MNSDTQLKVQAYLDNELSTGEARRVADLISSDRDAQQLYAELLSMKEILGANEPAAKLEESREFYWSGIQRRIEAAERAPAKRVTQPFWIRLMAPLAGTALLLVLLLSLTNPPPEVVSQNLAIDSAESASQPFLVNGAPLFGQIQDLAPDVSTVTFRSEQEGVTVVWLTASY